jgi:hypothetical protein
MSNNQKGWRLHGRGRWKLFLRQASPVSYLASKILYTYEGDIQKPFASIGWRTRSSLVASPSRLTQNESQRPFTHAQQSISFWRLRKSIVVCRLLSGSSNLLVHYWLPSTTHFGHLPQGTKQSFFSQAHGISRVKSLPHAVHNQNNSKAFRARDPNESNQKPFERTDRLSISLVGVTLAGRHY